VFYNLDARLIVAIEQFVRHLALGSLVGEFKRLRAVPLHVDDRDESTRRYASDRSVGFEIL
jgi:hypothetical protein